MSCAGVTTPPRSKVWDKVLIGRASNAVIPTERHRALANGLKSQLFMCGLGGAYQNLWWRQRSRNRSPWTDWNREKRAVFVHVPKNAGTSVYASLDIKAPRETHCTAYGYKTSDPGAWQDAFTFGFVRNPWDRFVSAFHYLKHQPLSRDDAQWCQQVLSPFDDFSQFAIAMRDRSFRSSVLMWRHFSPQCYYFSDLRGHLIVDYLARFERISEEFEFLGKKLNVGVSEKRENAVERAPYQGYYDDTLRDIVGRVYARDIQLFGYRFDD